MNSVRAGTRSLVIYLPDLSGGGAERLHLRLAPLFRDAGMDVTILLDRRQGALADRVPEGIRLVELQADRQIKAVFKLARYLHEQRPDVLIANMEHMNIMAVVARMASGAPTRVIVTQHNVFSEQVKRPSFKFRALPFIYRLVLPFADHIVAVSVGVADDLARTSGLRRDRIAVIYNGVVSDDFDERLSSQLPTHPWRECELPVIAGMGRFVPQKDFPTLIKAFAKLSTCIDARLLLLGEGPMRAELERLIASLGIADRVSLPGFVDNPLPDIRSASVFVLSSRFEGFGNVVAEALSCGTPVVSTNCRHGPAEILENGKYGALVPVGDPSALAEAMLSALREPHDKDRLRLRGAFFSARNCAAAYRGLIS